MSLGHTRARLNIFIEPDHAKRLEQLAAHKGVSKSAVIAAALASFLSPDGADRLHQNVINASMGSFARVRTYVAELSAALAGLAVPILGCALEGADVHALPALRDAVIVIGSEGRGLSAAVKSLVTQTVTIPRYGGAESLNAGVAAAIVCDNLRRALK